ncbi:RidA family protein [Phreatobacter stygius]|uniref:RidA family protein n=1 Tax=Phreatobacter stygius TaxID=1940610 RepID=A0A4D7B0I8_9HYPH|nr:RidA family protein [Phreatobacter stygius]QCI64318.1 RidA family protein [Phreatobacter stygius]
MLDKRTPAAMPAPFAKYSHAVIVPAGTRMLFCSGQLGVSADGTIPEDAGAQADLCFTAIGHMLEDAGMGFADIVRINAFVTDRAHMAGYMASRDRHMPNPPPASTLMIVTGFTRPEFKVEVEIVAAKVD